MTICIIAGGADPGAALIKKCAAQADKVFCADRGALWAKNAGVRPDLLIGDMDSVPPDVLDAMISDGVKTLRYPVEKDMTDTELALEMAANEGARSVTLLGALGGRIDHTLANIGLMVSYRSRGVSVAVMDSRTAMFVGERTITFRAQKGSIVSMFPLEDDVRVIRTEGLYYPLNDVKLQRGSTLCMSNVMTSDCAIFDVRNGAVLMIISAEADGQNH